MKRSSTHLKHGLSSIATALALIAAPAAHALPTIIDTWQVQVNAAFLTTPGSYGWDTSNGTGGTKSISATQAIWGEPAANSGPNGKSSLTLTNATNMTTSVNTNGSAVNNITLTHANNPITGTTLNFLTLASTLTLTPLIPTGGSGLSPVTVNFQIKFKETPNDDNPCAGGGANGQGVNSAGCADIFVIDQSSLNYDFTYNFNNTGDQTYYISFFETSGGLQPLPPAACLAATGSSNVCLGFRTPENETTPATFAAKITTKPVTINPVPEPATLVMLGIGLMGLGAVRRRKAA